MLNFLLLTLAVVIFCCVLLNNASLRIGVPVLLAFILFGLIYGTYIVPTSFDERQNVGDLCTLALIFIMFYGGFGTRWKSARPIVVEAGLLATVGVFLTAAITGVGVRFLLGWDWVESLLLGSVVASTDAASVFSILRSRKLGLRNGLSPLLEVESGSNDPCSNMLTIVMVTMLSAKMSAGATVILLVEQLGLGVLLGVLIAKGALWSMRKINFSTSGLDSMFVLAVAVFSYALPSLVGGNGYLSVYIVGIMMGNADLKDKKVLVGFFDGITSLMQVFIFFSLGLLADPGRLLQSLVPALIVSALMIFVSRPASVAAVLCWFRKDGKMKYGLKQQALVSFCGLRGAASIAFAIVATTSDVMPENDIFSVVFCIVLISISLQGSFLPLAAKGLDMIDPEADVMTTFSDFSEEVDLQFSNIHVDKGNPWTGKSVKEFGLPSDLLLVMLIRPDGSKSVPNGDTVPREGDRLIICSKSYAGTQEVKVDKFTVPNNAKYKGMTVAAYKKAMRLVNPRLAKGQLILLRREDKSILPHGNTVIQAGDILYVNEGI